MRILECGKVELPSLPFHCRLWLEKAIASSLREPAVASKRCAFCGRDRLPAPRSEAGSHAFTGSDQARKGRLVNALAIRGDEGRGTLR